MARIRLDKLIVKRKIAPTLDVARELLEQGQILVNGATQKNPASFIEPGASIELLRGKAKYVSRGGLKLEHALKEFEISLANKRCLDVGASTGGFTDCMIQNGASHVVAIDVGKGQLDDKIRHHENVTIFEKFNAKDLNVEAIEGKCAFCAIDVSFTSVLPLIPAIISVLEPTELVVLIKPQFELPGKFVDVRGVVNAEQAHIECVMSIRDALAPELSIVGITYSPVTGAKGNIEFLAHVLPSSKSNEAINDSRIGQCVNNAHLSLKKES